MDTFYKVTVEIADRINGFPHKKTYAFKDKGELFMFETSVVTNEDIVSYEYEVIEFDIGVEAAAEVNSLAPQE